MGSAQGKKNASRRNGLLVPVKIDPSVEWRGAEFRKADSLRMQDACEKLKAQQHDYNHTARTARSAI